MADEGDCLLQSTPPCYTLELKNGSNFVSLPVNPQDKSVEGIFGEAMDNISQIRRFDPVRQKWLSYTPSAPDLGGDRLEIIPDGAAFFVDVTGLADGASLAVRIFGEKRNDLLHPLHFHLYAGWNAFGVANAVSVWDIYEKGVNIEPTRNAVYRQMPDGTFEQVSPDEPLVVSRGYWVRLDADMPVQTDLAQQQGTGTTGTEDSDNDGVSDSDERLMGTNPMDANSKPEAGVLAELREEYPYQGNDLKLGPFEVSSVRYRVNNDQSRLGVGIIRERPEPLRGLFRVKQQNAPADNYLRVDLEYKDSEVIRAFADNIENLTLGPGGGNALRMVSGIEGLNIDKDGVLSVEVSASITTPAANGIQLPERFYSIVWDPEVDVWNPGNNFIQLVMALGNEGAASLVWRVGDNGTAGLIGGSWLLTPPPGAQGLFEPAILKTGTEIKWVYSDKPLPESWISVTPRVTQREVAGQTVSKIIFEGTVDKLTLLGGLSMLSINGTERAIAAYENGIINAGTADGNGRIPEGQETLTYHEGFLTFHFEGWSHLKVKGFSLKPDMRHGYKAMKWNPSAVLYASTENDEGLRKLAAGVEIDLEILANAVKAPGAVGAGASAAGGGAKDMFAALLSKFKKQSPSPEYIEMQDMKSQPEQTADASAKKESPWKAFEGTGVRVGMFGELEIGNDASHFNAYLQGGRKWSLQFDNDGNPVLGVRAKSSLTLVYDSTYWGGKLRLEADGAWKSPGFDFNDLMWSGTGKPDYRQTYKLDGSVTGHFPNDMFLVGGKDLTGGIRYFINRKGYNDVTKKFTYTARRTVYGSLVSREETSLGDSGWDLSIEDITVEFKEVEFETKGDNVFALFQGIGADFKNYSVRKATFHGTLSAPDDETFQWFESVGATFIMDRNPDTGDFKITGVADLDVNINENVKVTQVLLTYNSIDKKWVVSGSAEFKMEDGNVIIGTVMFQSAPNRQILLYAEGISFGNYGEVEYVMISIPLQGGLSPSFLVAYTIDNENMREAGIDPVTVEGSWDKDNGLVAQLENIPVWNTPGWVRVQKVENLTVRYKSKTDFDIHCDVTLLFDKFKGDYEGAEAPGLTMGASYSRQEGWQFRGTDMGPFDFWTDGFFKMKINELSFAMKKTDQGVSQWRANGEVKLLFKESIKLDNPALATALPKEMLLGVTIGTEGFIASTKWATPPVIKLADKWEIKLKEITVSKTSPWKFGLGSVLVIDGKEYPGNIGAGQGGLEFSSSGDQKVSFALPGGFGATIKDFRVKLGAEFALAGDVTLTVPEGNVVRSVVGEKFNAQVSGTPTEFSFATATSVNLDMNMGAAGKASLKVQRLALASSGSFSGAGKITLNGATTDFVIGMQGQNVYFVADFGQKGIDMNMANVFILNIKNKIGLKTVMGMQMLEIDDMYVKVGVEGAAGFSGATQRFFYFFPSSVPPVGFAFFDNLEGNVHVVGFAVNVGLNFPAPNENDLKTLVQVVAGSFGGGQPDWQKLGTLSAPSFGVHDVYLKFPKVDGYVWKNNALEYTDNVFAGIFDSDKLIFVDKFDVGPKDFVKLASISSAEEVIQLVPGKYRKGNVTINLRGFNAGASYDLRETETIYEQKAVQKLPDMYGFLRKVMYADQNSGALPESMLQDTLDNAEVAIVAKASGKCFDVPASNKDNDKLLHQWTCNSGDNQKWKLAPKGNGYYNLTAKHSGKCAVVYGNKAANGQKIAQFDCGGQDNRVWKLVDKGGGYYNLVSKLSGRCLNLHNASTSDGAEINQWDCSEHDSMKWKLVKSGGVGSSTASKQVTIPSELGGGTATVNWEVMDPKAELEKVKALVEFLAPDSTWQGHLGGIWKRLSEKAGGPTLNGNKAVFKYANGISVEVEMKEYEGSFDVTGLKMEKSVLKGKFGTVTLYKDANFGGTSFVAGDDANLPTTSVGTRTVSSVKIDGRGKATIYDYAGQGMTSPSTEITKSASALGGMDVGDNRASSVKVYYDLDLGGVTNWRIRASFDSGLTAELDSGGIVVNFPDNVRVLTLLKKSRLDTARSEIVAALDDMKPYPTLFNNPKTYMNNYWSNKLVPLKSTASVDGISIKFKPSDDIRVAFTPLKAGIKGAERTVAGVRFNAPSGKLFSRFGKVTLFEHSNYQGNFLPVTEDIADMGSSAFGGDKASSVKVEEGGVATLYSGVNFIERWEYGYTEIEAKHSAKLLDVPEASHASDKFLHQWQRNGGDNQKWKLVPREEGYYNLVAKHSGKCAVVYGNKADIGQKIAQFDCGSASNRVWKLVDKGGGYFNIISKLSDRCLDVAEASHANGFTIHQWDCHGGDNQKWKLNLSKVTYATTEFTESSDWLGGKPIGNDSVRAIKVFSEIPPGDYTNWSLSRSLKTQGSVDISYNEGSADNKVVLVASLMGSENRFKISYDSSGNKEIQPITSDGFGFPLDGYTLFVNGDKKEIAGLMDAASHIRLVKKSVVIQGGASAALNANGGITAAYSGANIAPTEIDSPTFAFTLPTADGVNLLFNVSNTGGFNKAQMQGAEPKIVPVYFNDSGVPQGIKYPVGQQQGGLFMDAHLNAGSKDTVRLDLFVSGAIQTDGNFYFKGNGDLVIANFTLAQATVTVSSADGLYIKGKMDFYTHGVDIEGYLKPNGVFSFTGTAHVMVAGTGLKGTLTVDNSGLGIYGGLYLANAEIMKGAIAIKDGKASFSTNLNIGFAGINATTWVQFAGGVGAGVKGKAYLDVDVPITIWGATDWDCATVWGVRGCWPTAWGWITVGHISQHYDQSFGPWSVTATKVTIQLAVANMDLDFVKPEVKIRW